MYHGNESDSFLGPKIWDLGSNGLKSINNLEAFKKTIKNDHQRNAIAEFL